MAGKKTGKRLLTWVLVLVMALSLLPLNALAKDVRSTEYGWIRIYLDEATKKDLKALDGLSHQVRIVSTKYPGGMHACAPVSDYWWTENNFYKVTANNIKSIDLAGDEAIGSSNKISIPIQGKVTVSEGYHKGVTKVDSYSYLCIEISKLTPEPPKAPDAPNYDNLKTLIGDITVNCTNTEATHSDKIKTYALIEDSYTTSEVAGDAENGYTCTVTINSQKYVEQFDSDTGATHTPKDATATVTLEYKNSAWLVKNGTPISFNVVCDAAPADPKLGENFDFSANKMVVDVICETTSDHNDSYGLMNDYYTVDKKTKLSSDRWQCEITINLDKYFALYNSEHTGHTRDKEHKEATAIMRIYPTWYASSGKWIFVESGVTAAKIYVKCDATPTEPSKEEVKKLLGDNAVQIICTNDKATHTPKSKGYALIEDSYASDGVKGDAENGYTYTVTIKSEKYVNQFDTDTGAVHTPKNATATVTLEYKNNAWLVKSGTPISFNVVCDAAPTYPVYVYAFFAHNGTPLKDEVTVNGKPIEWNEDANKYKEYFVTLGVYPNGTTQKPTDGAMGLLDLAALKGKEYETATGDGSGTKNGVALNNTSFPSPSGKVCKGAAGYPEIEDKLSWHLDGQVNVYTVTYDYNDGTTQGAPTSNGYYFGSYTIAAAPQRDGYTFTGWKDGDTTYQAGQKIDKLSKDLNLVAQWKENTIPTYTFDLSNSNIIKVDKKFVSKYGRSAEKSFTATVTIEKETYTAVVDPDSPILPNVPNNRSAVTAEPTYIGKATGTVTLKTGKTTKAFDFGKESKFQLEPGDYRITVKETNGGDRYVNYDDTTYTYKFIVDNEGKINIDTPITCTFTNKYTKRHSAATPSKPTLNTGDHYAYVMGYPDGTVRPNGSITRAEVSAILFRLLSDKTRDEYFTTESSFTDVKAGAWYNNSIATLEKAGVIVDTAKGGAFRPNEAITRAELAAMLAQFSDAKPVKGVKFSDVSAEHWAYEAIAIAAKMGWIEGYPDGTFRPDATITRAEMMTLVNRALERVPSDEDHLLSKRVMLTFPDCKSGDWFYIAVQEATNSHTYERAATEKNGDEQWTALRANRDWTLLEK